MEIDSLSMLKAIQSIDNSYPTHVYSLIEYCKLLLRILGNPPIEHVYREANVMANWLAKKAVNSSFDFTMYDSPPMGLLSTLMYDFIPNLDLLSFD